MEEHRYNSIKNFPIEVVQKMLERQVEQGNPENIQIFEEKSNSNLIGGGFTWHHTEEGAEFWCEIIEYKKFDVFFEKYPNGMKNKKPIYKEEIKKFPAEIIQKMLERQVEQGNLPDVKVFERNKYATQMKKAGGFDWNETVEGTDFWKKIIHYKDFDHFYQKYPKSVTKIDLPDLKRQIEATNPLVYLSKGWIVKCETSTQSNKVASYIKGVECNLSYFRYVINHLGTANGRPDYDNLYDMEIPDEYSDLPVLTYEQFDKLILNKFKLYSRDLSKGWIVKCDTKLQVNSVGSYIKGIECDFFRIYVYVINHLGAINGMPKEGNLYGNNIPTEYQHLPVLTYEEFEILILNNKSNGKSKTTKIIKAGSGLIQGNTRTTTRERSEISFGGRGNGLEKSNRKRRERSVQIGTKLRSDGEGLCVRRSVKRTLAI